jgi:prophage DNA circulation protein
MARNWLWRKASFDGASFYVDAQELGGGRRLVVHQYPGAERHDVEDMGRKAGEFEVTAYFNSETADTDSAALVARLERGGPGLLTIPMFGSRRVIAREWRPGWTRNVLNYVGFHIQFVEAGSAGAPIPLGLGQAELAVMGVSLGAALGSAISGAVADIPQASWTRRDMLSSLAAVVAQIAGFRAITPLPAKVDSAAKVALDDAAEAAKDPSSDPGVLAGEVFSVLDDIVIEAQDAPAASVEELRDMHAAALAARAALVSRWGISELVTIVPLAAALIFAGEAARLAAIRDYRDRASAQAARSRIYQDSAPLVSLYAELGIEATVAFDTMIGRAVRHLSSRIPNLAPVVIVETGRSLPSNVLAYRLYGDPERGIELVHRNAVATPCLMPTKFEASAT